MKSAKQTGKVYLVTENYPQTIEQLEHFEEKVGGVSATKVGGGGGSLLMLRDGRHRWYPSSCTSTSTLTLRRPP